jgi:sterol desaturase/sphingolipid hydroxylase (fatty acid hydroxylase superfamily)
VASWLGDWATYFSSWCQTVIFLAFALWETAAPERRGQVSVARRWVVNFALWALMLVILSSARPTTLAGKLLGVSSGTSLFGAIDRLGGEWAVLVTGLLLIDLASYALHRLQHRVFFLWRFHAVHHADIDMDLTTTLRHHPGETLTSACLLGTTFAITGLPIWVTAVYGLLSIGGDLFNHANIRISPRVDAWLRTVLVTPRMHRVHHSACPEHFETNFGNLLSLWDRLFWTHRALAPHEDAAIAFGVPEFTAERYAGMTWSWILPFVLRRPVPLPTLR